MTIKFAKADKGNAIIIVVIDKQQYEEKLTEHLFDDQTYRELTNNPIKYLQNKVNRELMKLK